MGTSLFSRLSKGTLPDSSAFFGVCQHNFGALKKSLGAWKERRKKKEERRKKKEEERKIRRFSGLYESGIGNVLQVVKMHSRPVFGVL